MSMPFSFWGFTPQSFAGLQWWLDSARGVTISTGVSQWNDNSGFNRNAIQASTPNQPIFSAGAFGSYPGIGFNGATTFMSAGITVNQFFNANNTDTTIAVVFRSTAVLNEGCMLGSEAAQPNNWVGIYAPYSTTATTLWDAGPFSTCRLTESITWPTSSVGVFTRSGNTSSIYKNNVASSGAVSGNYASGTNVPTIGAQDGAVFFNGVIAEICAWNVALTANQISILSRYWGVKYGITVS